MGSEMCIRDRYERQLKVDRFTFKITNDPSVDALCAIEVMVYFMGEPCCDDSGHQYRLYLPAGMKDSSVTAINFSANRFRRLAISSDRRNDKRVSSVTAMA